MIKKAAFGFLLGLTIGAVAAKGLPGLYCLREGEVLHAADFNAVIEHVQELERKMAGVQKQITRLHASKENKHD